MSRRTYLRLILSKGFRIWRTLLEMSRRCVLQLIRLIQHDYRGVRVLEPRACFSETQHLRWRNTVATLRFYDDFGVF